MEGAFRSAQIVFLIDCGLVKHRPEASLGNCIKLACLKILSHYSHHPAYRNVRWSYKFYTIGHLPLRTGSHKSWKDCNTKDFDKFEEKLDSNLERERGLVPQTPRTPRTPRASKSPHACKSPQSEAPETEQPTVGAARYSHALYATITDFEWDAPDFASPVKVSRGRPEVQHTNDNLVFNFTRLPHFVAEYHVFTGHKHFSGKSLVDSVMSKEAQSRWTCRERRMRLFLVHTDNTQNSIEEMLIETYRDAACRLGGSLLYLSQLAATSTHSAVLPSLFGRTVFSPIPLVPYTDFIPYLLQTTPKRLAVKSEFINADTHTVSLGGDVIMSFTCWTTPNSIPATLNVIGRLDTRRGYSYEWLDSTHCHICHVTEEDVLASLTARHSVLVLTHEEDEHMSETRGYLYLFSPLTPSLASLTLVKIRCHLNLIASLSHNRDGAQSSSLLPLSASHFAPCYPPNRSPTEPLARPEFPTLPTPSAHVSHTKRRNEALSYVRDVYRTEMSASLRLVQPPAVKQEPVVSEPTAPALTRKLTTRPLSKRASKQFVRGSAALEKSEQLKTVKRLSGELSASQAADNRKFAVEQMKQAKKITLTMVAHIALSTEEELLAHIQTKYEEACTGVSAVLLSGQAIVNTVLCYFNNHQMPETGVGAFLRDHIIKGVPQVRRSCMHDSKRKVLECQTHIVLLMEIHALTLQNEDVKAEKPDWSEHVEEIYKYAVAMSVGKPQVLQNFVHDVLVPSYQLTLAGLLCELLETTGQDVPASLARFLSPEKVPAPDLPHTSRSASTPGLPLSTDPYSHVGSHDSQSRSMWESRSLQIRSRSDVSTHRSIAVPSELVKKRKSIRRSQKELEGARLSEGVASRTRSRTPVKSQSGADCHGRLTEFPAGFLSRMKDLPPSASCSDLATIFSSDLRRSPRLAAQTPLDERGDSLKGRVKRDLFASPTTKSRRLIRSSRESQSETLVPETPVLRHSKKSLSLSFSCRDISVVDESPLKFMRPKPCLPDVLNHTMPAAVPSNTLNESHDFSSTAGTTVGQTCLPRRKSFFGDKRSRNVTKMEALENRMKCALGTNKCTPRRVTALILKEAFSQPTQRIMSRVEPEPLSTSYKSSTHHSSLSTPQKNLKKQLFMSPGVGTNVKFTVGEHEELVPERPLPRNTRQPVRGRSPIGSIVSLPDGVNHDPHILVKDTPLKEVPIGPFTPKKSVRQFSSPRKHTARKNIIFSPCAKLQVGCKRGQSLSPNRDSLKNSPSCKKLATDCACIGVPTPRSCRKSPLQRAAESLSQTRVCQFTQPHRLDFGEPGEALVVSPSPRKHMFIQRKTHNSASKTLFESPESRVKTPSTRLKTSGTKYSPNVSASDLEALLNKPLK